MRHPFRILESLLFSLLILECTVGTGSASAQTAGSEIVWLDDLASAGKQAQAEGKYVLIDFSSKGCSWCTKILADMQRDPKFPELRERVVFVRKDIEADSTLAREHGINTTPTLLLLTAQGVEIDRVPGVRRGDPTVRRLLDYMMNVGTLEACLEDLKSTPNDPELCMTIGEKFYYRSDYDSACHFYSLAVQHDLMNMNGVMERALFELGKAELEAKRYEEAVEHFTKLVTVMPRSALAEQSALYVPFVYDRAGDKSEAIEEYRKFIEEHPNSKKIDWVNKEIERLQKEL